MTNRFNHQKQIPDFLRLPLRYLFFAAILAAFLFSVSTIQENTLQKQMESLDTALMRDITHCYAVEGFYPPSLTYLEEHYGLTYDKNLFFVDYQPIGSNIRPDVTILLKEDHS